MIETITTESATKLLEPKISILLVKMDGCKACDFAKEHYETISNSYNNISFFQANLNDIIDLYVKYADKDNGQPKIIAPMFYVFVKEEQSDSNEHGHIGGIDGADIPALQSVLGAMNG